MLTVWAVLVGASAASSVDCGDLPGAPPLANATGLSCADFAGRCDAEGMSTAAKAKLMLHCPHTCKATVYSDGGGHTYCACIPGRDCCFDEPPDCATRAKSTVVSQVMCRKSLGLCMPEQAPQTTPAANQRRTSECSSEAAEIASSMNRLVADTQETVRQARSLTTGEFKDPHSLRVAMNAFQ